MSAVLLPLFACVERSYHTRGSRTTAEERAHGEAKAVEQESAVLAPVESGRVEPVAGPRAGVLGSGAAHVYPPMPDEPFRPRAIPRPADAQDRSAHRRTFRAAGTHVEAELMSIRIFESLRQAREDYRHAVAAAEAACERSKAQAAVAHRASVRRVLASVQPPPVVGGVGAHPLALKALGGYGWEVRDASGRVVSRGTMRDSPAHDTVSRVVAA